MNADEIRLKAYLLWEEAGRPEGQDLFFWLKAQQYLADVAWDRAALEAEQPFTFHNISAEHAEEVIEHFVKAAYRNRKTPVVSFHWRSGFIKICLDSPTDYWPYKDWRIADLPDKLEGEFKITFRKYTPLRLPENKEYDKCRP